MVTEELRYVKIPMVAVKEQKHVLMLRSMEEESMAEVLMVVLEELKHVEVLSLAVKHLKLDSSSA